MSQEQANLDLLRRIYAAYDQRDAQPMIDALAEDCRYYSMEPSDLLRFGSAYLGKAGFIQALADVGADWEVVYYRPTRMLADADHVVVLADVAFRHRSTGVLVEIDKVDTWRLRDGRIVHFKEYYDTLKAEQIVRRAAPTMPRAKRAKPKRAKRAAPKRAKRAATHSKRPKSKRRPRGAGKHR
jgi:ketosteroid isomerase-like protein